MSGRRYLWQRAGEPTAVDEDPDGRVMVVVSVESATDGRVPVLTYEEDLVTQLEAAGVAVDAIGTQSRIPEGPGPWVQVHAAGGPPPSRTHDGLTLGRLRGQVTVFGDHRGAMGRAQDAADALGGKDNFTVGA